MDGEASDPQNWSTSNSLCRPQPHIRSMVHILRDLMFSMSKGAGLLTAVALHCSHRQQRRRASNHNHRGCRPLHRGPYPRFELPLSCHAVRRSPSPLTRLRGQSSFAKPMRCHPTRANLLNGRTDHLHCRHRFPKRGQEQEQPVYGVHALRAWGCGRAAPRANQPVQVERHCHLQRARHPVGYVSAERAPLIGKRMKEGEPIAVF
jgi:hypothetical protein